MKTRVSTLNLLFFIYSFFMIWPVYFSNIFIIILNNLLAVVGVLFLVSKKYIPQKLINVFALYYVVLIGITFYSHTDMATINIITSYSKLVVYLMVVDYMFTKLNSRAVEILYIVISILVFIDIISLILFPKGLLQTEYVWTQWTTTYDPVWFLGSNNNRIFYYIILNILTIWKYNEKLLTKRRVFFVFFIETVAICIERSSTSIVAMLLMDIAVCLFIVKKRFTKIRVNIYMAIYIIFEIILIAGSILFLKSLVGSIFHKDLTFSGRTIIWQQILFMIAQKPFFGWGYVGGEKMSTILGSQVFTSAHNQWLNFLFQGGIVLFSVALILFIIEISTIKRQKNNKNVFITTFFLISLLIEMLFEAQFNSLPVNLVIVILYEYSIAFKDWKKNETYI